MKIGPTPNAASVSPTPSVSPAPTPAQAGEALEAASTKASMKLDAVVEVRTKTVKSSLALGNDGAGQNAYARNQQLGKEMLKGGELQKQLKALGAEKGMPPGALDQWAEANPGLAYKLLQNLKLKEAQSPAGIPAANNDVF
jgi:hypothetical protein